MSAKAKKPAGKSANGYRMPKPLPAGEVLQDIYKKQWIIGPSIGKGGFGEIYSAKQADNKSNDYSYVIKIEPHENGPLFVEMHFYTRCAREADVLQFKKEKNLKHLGMPVYITSGSHVHQDEKYRFILMQKFAPKDVYKLFMENNKQIPAITAYSLALQMLDVLEYIHSKGYIHGDLKGANILLSEQNLNHAYLVDFGLAGKFTTDAKFVPNPKKMHNGTIEYLSRDAHQGVQTRRGDIEVLVYNLIHWLTGVLPWEGKKDPIQVQQLKESNMKDIKAFLLSCFENKSPDALVELLKYINKISHHQVPDYVKIKGFILSGLKIAGGKETSPLIFISSPLKRKSTHSVGGVSSHKRGRTDSKATNPATPKARSAKGTGRTKSVQHDGGDGDTNENDAPTVSKTSEMLRIEAMMRNKKAEKKNAKDHKTLDARNRDNDCSVRHLPRRGTRIQNYNEDFLASDNRALIK